MADTVYILPTVQVNQVQIVQGQPVDHSFNIYTTLYVYRTV